MKFNIYGRFAVDVRRAEDAWLVYRAEPGKRALLGDNVIPAQLEEHEIATFLDDMYHELAGPGQSVERVPD